MNVHSQIFTPYVVQSCNLKEGEKPPGYHREGTTERDINSGWRVESVGGPLVTWLRVLTLYEFRQGLPPVEDRRPYDDDKPDGYLESDKDFVLNNIDAAVEYLERRAAIARHRAQNLESGDE